MDRLIGETKLDELDSLRSSVASIIEDVRGLTRELRPSVLDDLGVVPALRTYIENYSNHYGIRVDFESQRLDANQETTIYRVIQEALTNAAKYADVIDVRVSVREKDTFAEVLVEDSGLGFVRDTSSQGVGLFSMEERARSVGGVFTVHSEPGNGTTVSLTIPK